MDIVARQMAMDLGRTMQLHKVHSLNPLKINFRCHICGDSAKDQYETRGWFYEYKGQVRYGCFNCNYNMVFGAYLKKEHPDLYREYLMERRRDQGFVSSAEKKKEEVDLSQFNKVIPTIQPKVIDDFGVRLDLLPDGHPAKMYMVNRLIPEDKLCLFWFTMDWKGLTNKVVPETYTKNEPEPRIVIPIFNPDGTISAMQGRALRASEKLRYVTIKSSEDANKVYGLERVDGDLPVFFLEGPIDSVFIDNALAIVGGNMSVQEAPFPETRAWVLDNEPRSVDTCARIKKLIDAGERVVLWDKCRWKSKDVNDMILKEGASVEDVNEYLLENVVSGLSAQMRFKNWCKAAARPDPRKVVANNQAPLSARLKSRYD